jgi:hypothetical protein
MRNSRTTVRRGWAGIACGALVLGLASAPDGAGAAADTTRPQLTTSVDPLPGVRITTILGFKYFGGTARLTATATDGGSGVKNIACLIDTATTQTFPAQPAGAASLTATTDFVAQGFRSFTCRATDVAGNESRPQSNQFVVDATPPVAGATLNPGGVSSGPISVTVAATDPRVGSGQSDAAGAGVNTTSASIDGALEQEYFGDFHTYTVSTPGPHTVTYWATDKVFNKSVPKTISFYIDQTAPTVRSTNGSSTLTVTPEVGDAGPAVLTGTANDDRGVTKVRVTFTSAGDSDVSFSRTVTASCLGCGNTGTPVTWSLDLSALGLPAGVYATQITAFDQVGNTSTAGGPTVFVQ